MNLNLKRPGFVEREPRCSTRQAMGQSKPPRLGSLYPRSAGLESVRGEGWSEGGRLLCKLHHAGILSLVPGRHFLSSPPSLVVGGCFFSQTVVVASLSMFLLLESGPSVGLGQAWGFSFGSLPSDVLYLALARERGEPLALGGAGRSALVKEPGSGLTLCLLWEESQALPWALASSLLLERSNPVPGRSLGIVDIWPDG